MTAANPLRTLVVRGRTCRCCDLPDATRRYGDLARLPFSLRILLGNLIRHAALAGTVWDAAVDVFARRRVSLPFRPGRGLLRDLLGVPVLVDLAALRDAVAKRGGDPRTIAPRIPVDCVIDHSLMAEHAGTFDALRRNQSLEHERNAERSLRWCRQAFPGLRVIPSGKGILHRINLEHLARVVWSDEADPVPLLSPDTVFGTDSHTSMINAPGVLGWGVGGLEAEAVLLGRGATLPFPPVVGVQVHGRRREGVGATDLVPTLTETLRRHGVVEKSVEFAVPWLDEVTLPDRATIADMAPEHGATCIFWLFAFP